MTRVGRAIEKGETQGFMKVVVDAETRQILGAAILGTGGDEAIHGILDMMNARATARDLRGPCPSTPPSPSSSPPSSSRPAPPSEPKCHPSGRMACVHFPQEFRIGPCIRPSSP